MVSAKRPGVVALAVALLLSGCVGVGPQQSPRTTVSPTGEATTVSPSTSGIGSETAETPSCRVERSEYGVAAPEKPETLDETTAERIAARYEKRRQRAQFEDAHDLASYRSAVARSEVEETDDGVAVTVELRVDARTRDGEQFSVEYPHEYEISEDGVVRDGTRIACWTGGD